MSGKKESADHGFKLEERRIRELDRLWGEAATAKNVPAVLAFYAADASLVWPNTPPVHGSTRIRAMWQEMIDSIDLIELRFEPDTIVFSPDGQLATDYGKVILAQRTNAYTTTRQDSKYLVVWKKVNDSWKVLYDCYNLNV